MIKNKKGLLILLISLLFIYIAISIAGIIPSGKKYQNTVFLGNNTKVNVSNNKIEIYNTNDKISKQKSKLYFKKNFVDGYIISEKADSSGEDNKFEFFTDNGEYLIPNNNFIAHTSDITIKVKETNSYSSKEFNDIYSFAKSKNITLPKDIVLDYLVINSSDLDGDNKEEYIYSVGLIEDETDYSSFVYMKKDEKYYLISREDSDYDGISNIRLSFSNLIDFNNDDNYEFVVSKLMSEYGPNYYELYNFDGKSFTKIGGE